MYMQAQLYQSLLHYLYFIHNNYSGIVIHHDDVIKWKHYPRNWQFVRGIHRSPVNSPRKGQWGGALMFSLICAGMNAWVNNREAGDLKRHRANYDVTVCPISRKAQAADIFYQGRQRPVYPIRPKLWLLVMWRRKDPGHQQLYYWSKNSAILTFWELQRLALKNCINCCCFVWYDVLSYTWIYR